MNIWKTFYLLCGFWKARSRQLALFRLLQKWHVKLGWLFGLCWYNFHGKAYDCLSHDDYTWRSFDSTTNLPSLSQHPHMVWGWNLHQPYLMEKITIDDIIVLVTWLWYNLQTRNKIRNRYPISGSIVTLLISNFARYDKGITFMRPSWQSRDMDIIYRSNRKWVPDLVLYGVLTTNFVRYVRMTKELYRWHHHGGHVS